jgi:HAD superfamily hydrolase (TIGR01509 family)
MKAVIFDMDGVLVDSEPIYAYHQEAYLRELAIDLSQRSAPILYRGMTSKVMWSRLKEEYALEEEVEELVLSARSRYLEYLRTLPEIPIVPGARELIHALRSNGYSLAIGSSSSSVRIELFLRRLNLADEFDAIVSGNDVIHGKPDPEVFLLAAKKIGASPKDCVVIEDAKAGIEAANAAGMKSIGFTGLPDNKDDLSAADVMVTDFYMIAKYVKNGGLLIDL